jgi:2-polyprenyl-3-methyl-5-hydroxy-6-metoxy-1,4-benzoquinol methylase
MTTFQKVKYLISGLTNRIGQPRKCPACLSDKSIVADRKMLHRLFECQDCFLRYRYPVESPEQMRQFYQSDYQQKGLTTDLPTDVELASLMQNQFRNTMRDASHLMALFRELNIPSNARVLDFGASWGYYSWQLKNQNYDVTSYEISKPRAEFGAKLGLHIHTSLDDVRGPFDVIFSSHVLEHVPNPRQTLQWMAEHTKPGGVIVGFTPNGSDELQKKENRAYHLSWGFVHPVLLTAKFVEKLPFFDRVHVGSRRDQSADAGRIHQLMTQRTLDCAELVFAGHIKRPAV